MKQLLTYSLLLILALPLSAKILISPIDAMKENFGNENKIEKKNILLTNAQVQNIEDSAKVKLLNKIVRVFKATKDGKTTGHGVLINRKIRTKNGVVLYLISADSTLKGIEVVAFNEPMEYIPSDKWLSQFEDVKMQDKTKLSSITNITGATLSAKIFIDGSKVAFAIYDEVLKGK
ncbi:FMN-binding protein [Sulfurimonas sp.]|uniref:FMN-binding protein n=1 Tax=Sulfurimonas sp. TaxID=2022749 RepID=UPI0025D029CF|nr:FMN-binding protein [Sulfurimonas sp.]MCK9454678.1 FMN-binding protein [Sulfurimonas sp.]